MQQIEQVFLNHGIFSAGSGLHDFDKGIKPGFVDVPMTHAEVRISYKALFDLANPSDMSHFKAICSKNGGFCR